MEEQEKNELFSKKQKRLRGEVPDVYQIRLLPKVFRIQVVHIISDTIGLPRRFEILEVYKILHQKLCREYGKFDLGDPSYESDGEQIINFFLLEDDVEKALDVIQLLFQFIDQKIRSMFQEYRRKAGTKLNPDQAITELNERFKEHGIGYSYEGGEIIKIDSTFIHSEITKPTINLLYNQKFAGANEEYLRAHDHYRHNRNKECLAECLKAFESTLKIICQEKNWNYKPTDTSRKLIQICFQNNLVPSFSHNQFTSLQSLMESGIPTLRNKLGGHGQGKIPTKVDDKITRYGLNLTGSNIIFLIEQSGL